MTFQVDVGKIKFLWRGNYDAATTYTNDDVVYYGGSAWVNVVPANLDGTAGSSTGQTPATASSHWNKMAQGSDLGSLTGLSAGDLVYFDGADFQRIPAGSQYQFLQGGPTPAFTGNGYTKIHFVQSNTQYVPGTSWVDLTDLTLTVTPLSLTSRFLITSNIHVMLNGSGGATQIIVRDHPDLGATNISPSLSNTYENYDSTGNDRWHATKQIYWSPNTLSTFRILPQAVRYSSGTWTINESGYYFSSLSIVEVVE